MTKRRPLYIEAYIGSRLISRVLIDSGAIMNVLLLGISRKLGKTHRDLKETNMKMTNFIGERIDALGYYIPELIWEPKNPALCSLLLIQTRVFFAFGKRLHLFQHMCSTSITSTVDVLE